MTIFNYLRLFIPSLEVSRVIFLLFLIGCNTDKLEHQSVPKDMIAPKKMKEILCAIHLAEARISESAYQIQDSASYFFQKLKKDIFKKNKTDSLTFQKSFVYYSSKPELLSLLYNQITDSLKKMEEKLKKEEEKNKKKTEDKKKI